MEEDSLDKHLAVAQVGGPASDESGQTTLASEGHFPSAVADSRLLQPGTDWVPWPWGRQRENRLLLFCQLARVSANRAPPSQAATSPSCCDPVRRRGQAAGLRESLVSSQPLTPLVWLQGRKLSFT